VVVGGKVVVVEGCGEVVVVVVTPPSLGGNVTSVITNWTSVPPGKMNRRHASILSPALNAFNSARLSWVPKAVAVMMLSWPFGVVKLIATSHACTGTSEVHRLLKELGLELFANPSTDSSHTSLLSYNRIAVTFPVPHIFSSALAIEHTKNPTKAIKHILVIIFFISITPSPFMVKGNLICCNKILNLNLS
jgi:hypothetical protein